MAKAFEANTPKASASAQKLKRAAAKAFWPIFGNFMSCTRFCLTRTSMFSASTWR